MNAWIALEIACQDALEDPSISYSFEDNLKRVLNNKGQATIEWGSRVWQRVRLLQELRKDCVHRFAAESDLFPDLAVADSAITTVRDAAQDIYQRVGRDSPAWIDDDLDRGWSTGKERFASLTLTRAGAKPEDPQNVRVVYVHEGKEHVSDVLPPGSDHVLVVEALLAQIRVPISAVRVYVGEEILWEQELNMRGT